MKKAHILFSLLLYLLFFPTSCFMMVSGQSFATDNLQLDIKLEDNTDSNCHITIGGKKIDRLIRLDHEMDENGDLKLHSKLEMSAIINMYTTYSQDEVFSNMQWGSLYFPFLKIMKIQDQPLLDTRSTELYGFEGIFPLSAEGMQMLQFAEGMDRPISDILLDFNVDPFSLIASPSDFNFNAFGYSGKILLGASFEDFTPSEYYISNSEFEMQGSSLDMSITDISLSHIKTDTLGEFDIDWSDNNWEESIFQVSATDYAEDGIFTNDYDYAEEELESYFASNPHGILDNDVITTTYQQGKQTIEEGNPTIYLQVADNPFDDKIDENSDDDSNDPFDNNDEEPDDSVRGDKYTSVPIENIPNVLQFQNMLTLGKTPELYVDVDGNDAGIDAADSSSYMVSTDFFYSGHQIQNYNIQLEVHFVVDMWHQVDITVSTELNTGLNWPTLELANYFYNNLFAIDKEIDLPVDTTHLDWTMILGSIVSLIVSIVLVYVFIQIYPFIKPYLQSKK